MPRIRPLILALATLLAAPPLQAQNSNAGAYLAAQVASAENDYRAAAAWYARAMLSDPTNPALLEGAVISNIAIGEMEIAAGFGKRLLEAKTPTQTTSIAVVAQMAKTGDFAGILADDTSLESVGALLNGLVRAWAELGSGRMSEALQAFDTIAATQGLEAFGLYHKALALASVGDFEGADDILSGRAAGPIAVMRRGVVAHVQILSQLERNADALALLDRSFPPRQDPGVDALRARLTAGDTIAFDVTRNAVDGIGEVFFTLATALNGEAADSYTLMYSRTAVSLRPDHSDAILLTAGLLELQDQFDLATAVYAQIPPTDPAYYVAEIGRADATYAAGRNEASIEILQALTRSHSDILAVHVALGDGLRREKRFVDAIASYNTAIAMVGVPEPQHWPMFFSRGICHEQQKDFAAADADFRKSLELNPDQPQVLNYLGYSMVDRGVNLDEALGLIERAVAAQPDQGYILDSLAWALFRLNRVDEALIPMEQASLLEPVDPVVTDHLGDVYWANGRVLEAQFQWRRALSFDPLETDATRIRRKLDIGLDAVLAEEGAAPLKAVNEAAAAD